MDDRLWLGPYLPFLVLGVAAVLFLIAVRRQGRAYDAYRREQDTVDAEMQSTRVTVTGLLARMNEIFSAPLQQVVWLCHPVF